MKWRTEQSSLNSACVISTGGSIAWKWLSDQILNQHVLKRTDQKSLLNQKSWWWKFTTFYWCLMILTTFLRLWGFRYFAHIDEHRRGSGLKPWFPCVKPVFYPYKVYVILFVRLGIVQKIHFGLNELLKIFRFHQRRFILVQKGFFGKIWIFTQHFRIASSQWTSKIKLGHWWLI